jgi:hypothetical protein
MEERRESQLGRGEDKNRALQQAGGMLFLEESEQSEGEKKRELGRWKPGSRLFFR